MACYSIIWLIANLHAENGDSLNYEHVEMKKEEEEIFLRLQTHTLNW